MFWKAIRTQWVVLLVRSFCPQYPAVCCSRCVKTGPLPRCRAGEEAGRLFISAGAVGCSAGAALVSRGGHRSFTDG